MGLSPEERRRIYEEEKQRIEIEEKQKKSSRRIGAFKTTKNERLASSIFVIIWMLALLIFFNFFNQYIAYYHHAGSPGVWTRQEILTPDFGTWLIILNVALALWIVGHICMIVFDNYLTSELVHIVLYSLGTWTLANFISIFPLDFSAASSSALSDNLPLIIKAVLAIIAFILGMVAFIKAIRLIVTLFLHWRNAN
jgi:hypothetical protein